MRRLLPLVLICASATACPRLSVRDTAGAPLDVAPEFELSDAAGGRVSLARLRASRPVVVVFSRGAWCSMCRRHLSSLAREAPRFEEAGLALLSVSSDAPEVSAALARELGIPFPLLSDPGAEVAARYGVAMEGVHDGTAIAVPSAFIVGRDGRIVWRRIGSYPWSTESADSLLATAKDLCR